MKDTNETQDESTKWDSGELGRDAKFVRKSTDEQAAAVEDSLDLQPITVRLQKKLIEQLKVIARSQGIGYQPMVRMILTQYAENSAAQKKQRA